MYRCYMIDEKDILLLKKTCVRICTGNTEICHQTERERERKREREREREVTQLTCGTHTATDLLVDRLRKEYSVLYALLVERIR